MMPIIKLHEQNEIIISIGPPRHYNLGRVARGPKFCPRGTVAQNGQILEVAIWV